VYGLAGDALPAKTFPCGTLLADPVDLTADEGKALRVVPERLRVDEL
jgi:hypothetical protein